MNYVVIEEYMNVDPDDESYESCDDAEEESDGSEKSIVNEYEGDEFDNDVVGEIDDMYIEGGIDELDDLLVYTDPSDFPLNEYTCDDGFELCMPTTNAGECALEVKEVVVGSGQRVQGHVILNQACTLLSRQDKTIRGYSGQKHFLQKLAAVDNGKCIPLLYPEAMMFPSLFYKMLNECGSLVGALPSCLLANMGNTDQFASAKDHVRSRLTTFGSSTSTNVRYISFMFDILTNLTLNREDSRIILNRGLMVSTGDTGLEVNGKDNTSLHDSIDSKKMVRCLCTSQVYHQMHYFLTFTCNQSKHFGTKMIKNWTDGTDWQYYFRETEY